MKSLHGLFAAAALLVLVFQCGCTTTRVTASPAFSLAQNQTMLPILPFSNILVPASFSESVFNDFVDTLNENRTRTVFNWYAIIKEDLSEVEKILPSAHIYLSGEIWSYIEDSGCCSTAIRVKSRLRIYRIVSRELLWEAEIPLESFFEHDVSTLALEREKLAKRLSTVMADELIKGLASVKRLQVE
jgi:hypothetical protein